MLVKALGELLGSGVQAQDGPYGALEDLYFDHDCWQVCDLVVAAGGRRTLLSVACVETDSAPADRLRLVLSRAHLVAEAGAWPMDDAVRWLDDIRVCSARHALGWHVLAEDGPIGVLADLLVERHSWSIPYLLANVSEEFGLPQIALSLDWAEPLDPREGTVRLRRTRAQLRHSPAAQLPSLRLVRAKG